MRRWLDRLPLRLRDVVAVVAALCVGYVITSHFEVLGRDEPPFVRSVARGQTAHLSYADVRVLDVRTAKYLGSDSSERGPVLASGVFVVALVEVTATREPTSLLSTWLVDDAGRKYRPSDRSGCDNNPSSDTGVPTYAMLCFEVPTRLLAEYRLDAARGNDVNDDTRQDDVADLALDIDPGADATSADPQAAYQVTPSSQEPFEIKTLRIEGADS